MSEGITPEPRRPERPPVVRLVKGQEVSLGCGTLVFIAIIVLIFGGRGVGNLESQVRSLRTEVGELKKAVEALTSEVKALRK